VKDKIRGRETGEGRGPDTQMNRYHVCPWRMTKKELCDTEEDTLEDALFISALLKPDLPQPSYTSIGKKVNAFDMHR